MKIRTILIGIGTLVLLFGSTIGVGANLFGEYKDIFTKNEVLVEDNKELEQIILEHEPESELDSKLISWGLSKAKNHIPKRIVSDILKEASQYKYYPMIVAIVVVESNFDPFSTSHKKAKGLTQVMGNIWGPELKEAGIIDEIRDLYDYKCSIAACNYILETYKNEHKDWHKVLNAYVGGDKSYVIKVLSNYAEYTLMLDDQDTKFMNRKSVKLVPLQLKPKKFKKFVKDVNNG